MRSPMARDVDEVRRPSASQLHPFPARSRTWSLARRSVSRQGRSWRIRKLRRGLGRRPSRMWDRASRHSRPRGVSAWAVAGRDWSAAAAWSRPDVDRRASANVPQSASAVSGSGPSGRSGYVPGIGFRDLGTSIHPAGSTRFARVHLETPPRRRRPRESRETKSREDQYPYLMFEGGRATRSHIRDLRMERRGQSWSRVRPDDVERGFAAARVGRSAVGRGSEHRREPANGVASGACTSRTGDKPRETALTLQALSGSRAARRPPRLARADARRAVGAGPATTHRAARTRRVGGMDY
jgi:hypothetical protein